MNLFQILAFSQGAAGRPTWYTTLLPLLFFGLVFYFLLMRPQIKQQKEHQNLVKNLKKGDKVITNGGIWAEVDEVENQTVRLRVSEKLKVRVSRSAISAFQPKPGATEDKK